MNSRAPHPVPPSVRLAKRPSVGRGGCSVCEAGRAGIRSCAAVYAFGSTTLFALLLVGAGVVLAPNPVAALPSFARQTGQPCSTCHSAFPQLTPYGRRFKLEGYTAGGTRCGPSEELAERELQIPIAGMTIPNFTHINKKLDPADTPKGFNSNDNTFDEATSVFFGGQIYCNFGAFSQGTYERPGSSWFLDNTDIRYANKFKLGETDVVYGVTANNNPTVQDPWNTTPAWSFPFVAASDALAPVPSAGTIIEGTFAGRVAGTGVYLFANDKFYLEGTAYGRSIRRRWKRSGSIRPIPQAASMVWHPTGARPTSRTGIRYLRAGSPR